MTLSGSCHTQQMACFDWCSLDPSRVTRRILFFACYAIQPCTSSLCHFIQSHMQNDGDLLHATVVKRGTKVLFYKSDQQHQHTTPTQVLLSKVSCLCPGRGSRNIFISNVNFLFCLLVWNPFHPLLYHSRM